MTIEINDDRIDYLYEQMLRFGASHQGTTTPIVTDEQLWAKARELDPELPAEPVASLIDDHLRDGYSEGRGIWALHMNMIAALIPPPLTATVEHSGGGTATLYVGPRDEDRCDADGEPLWAVIAGPGYFDRGRALAHQDEFTYGEPAAAHPGSLVDSFHVEPETGKFTEQTAADRIAELARSVIERRGAAAEDRSRRVEQVVEDAAQAMWTAVGEGFPEVETGDFGPGETMTVEATIRDAVRLWLHYNEPTEGIAPNRDAAMAIVAARKDAALDRLVPAAEYINDRQLGEGFPDGLVAEYIKQAVDSGRFRPLSDDDAARVLRERIDTLLGEPDGVREFLSALSDLVGVYRVESALVVQSEGGLCRGRLVDNGDLCLAVTDGDGEDGWCGPHAARMRGN